LIVQMTILILRCALIAGCGSIVVGLLGN